MNNNYLVPVAGNGLLAPEGLGRRALLTGLSAGALALPAAALASASGRPSWMQQAGEGMRGYGVPAATESVARVAIGSQPGTTGSGASRTPLAALEGTITPSGLHFERHHSGVPTIDPAAHRLMIHGLVERPLAFSLEALDRYPLVTQLRFLECSGNSAANLAAPEAPDLDVATLHGLVSQSEWVGVPLAMLLQEAGLKPEGRWVIAEGADAAAMSRSIPLAKALDDAMVALYQNGERLRPENGYPMRLFLPNYEGNMSVKWLRRLKVTDQPAMTKDETSKYTELMPDGRAQQFTFTMGVKSIITRPSKDVNLQGPGVYPITGLAWSGRGAIRRVEVSADGGRSWADAALEGPGGAGAMVRFRIPWRWQGQPATLVSRATDSTGAVQPPREAIVQARGMQSLYHYNGQQRWAVSDNGTVRNTYA
jgi:sulfane dehydrogenase subunit SoxC